MYVRKSALLSQKYTTNTEEEWRERERWRGLKRTRELEGELESVEDGRKKWRKYFEEG